MKNLLIFWGIVLLLHGAGCSEGPNSGNGPSDVIKENDRIFIEDRTGKRWDVTHYPCGE
jgi:hypothetical protein